MTPAETSEITSIDCIQYEAQSAVVICSWTALPPSDVYTVTLSDSEGKELRRREVDREFADFSGPDLQLETRYFVTVGQVAVSIFVTGSRLLYYIFLFRFLWIPLLFDISLTKMLHGPRIHL